MALTFTLIASAGGGNVKSSTKTSDIDWNPVMDAIIQVESEGNPNAVSGNSVGAMQITPILVRDCNDILKRRKSSKRFTMADRYSVAKSKEMFIITLRIALKRLFAPGTEECVIASARPNVTIRRL